MIMDILAWLGVLILFLMGYLDFNRPPNSHSTYLDLLLNKVFRETNNGTRINEKV